ncbi:MAG: diacylglycerol kinase family protein [Elusimicrobiota bacterium]
MEAVVIVNPAAGAGRSGARWPELYEMFRRVIGDFKVLKTHGTGHAVELAREELMNGAQRLIAVGGDGTWHELVEGYLSVDESLRAGAVLGCYPAGSGCDFARHMRFPRDDRSLITFLTGTKTKRVDAVRAEITGENGATAVVHLTNIAAFGLAGDVAWIINKTGKPFGGTASYLLVTLGLLARSRSRDYELLLDGRRIDERRFHTVILANTSTTGGGMKVAPDADSSDGLFEVVSFGEMSRWDMLKKFSLLYDGSHLGHSGITLRRGRRLEARALDGAAARLNIDGESCGALPAVFEILPGALPVLTP